MKPKIVVSKCLGFANCRYDGAMIPFNFINTLKEHVEFIPVCPEEEIGLGTPRPTIRLEGNKDEVKLIEPSTGRNLTDQMHAFCKKFNAQVGEFEGAILKAKSPSCGTIGIKVYDDINGIPRKPGKGLFAESVIKTFPLTAIEEEGRLRDYPIREHFLIKIFTIKRWNIAKSSGKISTIMDFQAHHKYLFMAYNQDIMREMGKLIANHKELGFTDVITRYEEKLIQLLAKPIRTSNKINAFMHVFGYFKKDLESSEKDFFLDQIKLYKENSIPYHSIASILKSWSIKYKMDYLNDQILFSPFPKELMSVRDSGKGITK